MIHNVEKTQPTVTSRCSYIFNETLKKIVLSLQKLFLCTAFPVFTVIFTFHEGRNKVVAASVHYFHDPPDGRVQSSSWAPLCYCHFSNFQRDTKAAVVGVLQVYAASSNPLTPILYFLSKQGSFVLLPRLATATFP